MPGADGSMCVCVSVSEEMVFEACFDSFTHTLTLTHTLDVAADDEDAVVVCHSGVPDATERRRPVRVELEMNESKFLKRK